MNAHRPSLLLTVVWHPSGKEAGEIAEATFKLRATIRSGQRHVVCVCPSGSVPPTRRSGGISRRHQPAWT
jgi:hypothetical protein